MIRAGATSPIIITFKGPFGERFVSQTLEIQWCEASDTKAENHFSSLVHLSCQIGSTAWLEPLHPTLRISAERKGTSSVLLTNFSVVPWNGISIESNHPQISTKSEKRVSDDGRECFQIEISYDRGDRNVAVPTQHHYTMQVFKAATREFICDIQVSVSESNQVKIVPSFCILDCKSETPLKFKVIDRDSSSKTPHQTASVSLKGEEVEKLDIGKDGGFETNPMQICSRLDTDERSVLLDVVIDDLYLATVKVFVKPGK